MTHVELGIEERRQIERLRLARTPVARIAARLRRHRSTIHRDLRRNRFVDKELPELDGPWGAVAQEMATGRRRRRRKLKRHAKPLLAVIDRLRAGGSPEQIAGRLRRDGGGAYASHETIHACACSEDGRERGLSRHPVQADAGDDAPVKLASHAGPCSRPSARSATARRPSRGAGPSATGRAT